MRNFFTEFFAQPKPRPADLIFVFKCPTSDGDTVTRHIARSDLETFIRQQQFSWMKDSKDVYVCILNGMVQFFATEQDTPPKEFDLDSPYSFFGKTIIIAKMDDMDVDMAVAELIDDLSLCVIEKTRRIAV